MSPKPLVPDPFTSVFYDPCWVMAAHLYGEPDCTFIPLKGYEYDFAAEDSRNTGPYMREGFMHRLYGPTRLNAHCN